MKLILFSRSLILLLLSLATIARAGIPHRQPGEPVRLTMYHDGESLSVDLRRSKVTVDIGTAAITHFGPTNGPSGLRSRHGVGLLLVDETGKAFDAMAGNVSPARNHGSGCCAVTCRHAEFEVTTEAGHRYTLRFDMQFEPSLYRTRVHIRNIAGPAITAYSYPAFLELAPEVDRAVVAHRFGIQLLRSFFVGKHSLRAGPLFTPFAWFNIGGVGYSYSEPVEAAARANANPTLSILFDEASGTHALHNDTRTHIAAGTSHTSSWRTLRASTTVDAAARGHWEEGETRDYPTYQEKLPFDRRLALQGAVLLKYPDGEGLTFSDFARDRLLDVPANSLLHVPSYMPGGHDRHFPDYLPPRSDWGTSEDFRALVAAARMRGILTMPYTNPTWWDENSPTVKKHGAAIAVMDAAGNPLRQQFGEAGGIVVSPSHPVVRERIRQTYREFTSEVPVDFLLEDQVGARDWVEDHNPMNLDRAGYLAQIAENVRHGATQIPLFAEGGFDLLAESAVAFCANMRHDWELPTGLPAGTFNVYPLAQIMASEHVAFYPHNLSGQYMVHSRAEFAHNILVGSNMAHDLGRKDHAWLEIAALVQRRLGWSTLGQRIHRLDDERESHASATLVYARGLKGIVNLHATKTLQMEDYSIAAPGAVLVGEHDGAILGTLAAFGSQHATTREGYFVAIWNEGAQRRVFVSSPFSERLGIPAKYLDSRASRFEVTKSTRSGTTGIGVLELANGEVLLQTEPGSATYAFTAVP